MNDQDKQKKKLIYFLLGSLLFHALLVWFFYRVPPHGLPSQAVTPPSQDVVFVRPEDILPPQKAQSSAQLPIADLPKPKEEKVPEKPRAISQYNSSVPKETVAKKLPNKADLKKDTSEEEAGPAKPKQKSPVKKDVTKKPSTGTPKKSNTESGSRPSLTDLQLKPSDYNEIKEQVKQEEKSPTPSHFPKDKTTVHGEDLMAQRLDMAAQGKGSGPGDHFVHDFLPNVTIGDKTYINAAANPNIQYFTRLKRAFRLRFNPRNPLVQHFRSHPLNVSQINVGMAMEVSPNGQLSKIFVVQSSGIPGYDEEAMQTVRDSSPFSSPPKEILSKDGMLRMTWNFTTFL